MWFVICDWDVGLSFLCGQVLYDPPFWVSRSSMPFIFSRHLHVVTFVPFSLPIPHSRFTAFPWVVPSHTLHRTRRIESGLNLHVQHTQFTFTAVHFSTFSVYFPSLRFFPLMGLVFWASELSIPFLLLHWYRSWDTQLVTLHVRSLWFFIFFLTNY